MIKASEKLRDKRIEGGFSIEDVEKATKIKAIYLDSIEKGQFNALPSISHAAGFVKNYANFLNISDKEIMPLFRREFDSSAQYRVLPKGFEAKDEFPLKGFKISQTLLLIGIIAVFLFAYILFQYRYAIINPPLDVYAPKDRAILSTNILEVKGKTEPQASIYINKEPVTVDEDGNFTKTISVFPGNFVLNIEAINKFKKISTVKRVVEIKPGY